MHIYFNKKRLHAWYQSINNNKQLNLLHNKEERESLLNVWSCIRGITQTFLGKKFVSLRQYPYKDNANYCTYSNPYKILDNKFFYADLSLCSMDAVKLAISEPILNPRLISIPFHPEQVITTKQIQSILAATDLAMGILYWDKKQHKKKNKHYPSMKEILAFKVWCFRC